LALLLAGFLAWLLSGIAGALYFNPRPFVEHNIQPLFAHGPDNGFPSEHTVLAMTLTSVIYFYRRRLATAALAMTLLVGAGRVWAHVHSWIDIAGGLVIGAAAGIAGVYLARYISKEFIKNSKTSPDEQPEQKSHFLPGAMRNREGVSHTAERSGAVNAKKPKARR
jgi:membrane-associated phospholipid phosphatase